LNWSRKKVIVTGGAGFIGGTIVDKLLSQGASVTVVDKLLFPNRSNIGEAKLRRLASIYRKYGVNEVPIHTLDLSVNPREFELLARDCDIVFHLSAVFGGREFVDIHQVECSKMLAIDYNVISASYAAGVRHLHYSSSACVYAPSLNRRDVLLQEDQILSTGEGWQSSDNLYGFAKLMGEMQLGVYYKEKGFESSISRYLTVYGPGELDASHAIAALVEKALDRQDPYVVWGSGEQERGFTYVDDIAAGSLLAAEHIKDARAVNLGWDKRYRIKDVATLILEISGHRPAGVVFDRSKPEGPFSRALDISRARNLLHWEPRVDLAEGLERTIAWHQNQRDVPLTPEIQV